MPVSPAMEALFRVHKRVVDGLDDESEEQSAPSAGGVGPTRLLVPGVQAATIIGKQGGTIKIIQEGSNATVRVSGKSILFSSNMKNVGALYLFYLVLG